MRRKIYVFLTLGVPISFAGSESNDLCHLSSLTYQSALSVTFNPNALGQERQAGAYATGVTYHPDGSLQGFAYGNSLIHCRTINSRGLPSQISDTFGSTRRLHHDFVYDQHANVLQITEGVDNMETRFLAYDARDRMTNASAPYIYGEELFEYDPLDNIKRTAMAPTGGGGYLRDYRFVHDAANCLGRINNPVGVLRGTSCRKAVAQP